MRITSVTLRNYRVHRELKVDFDPSRTLLGGPNETGKSTLIEALHRALFLKSKGNTENHRAMISQIHPGNPEVELTFESGNNSYVLKKRFGANGTTTLAPSNAVLLSGDEAESKLAGLLSVAAGIAGKAVVNQWAHLWVWQGQAGDDPSEHATAQHHDLLQRLQQMGGAGALLSELDSAVAKRFTETRDQIYTQAGKPKVGSELEKTETALALAQSELGLASDRVLKLESAAADFENASKTLQDTTVSLADLETELEKAEAKLRQLGGLRQQEAEQSPAAKDAAARCTALISANEQILKARAEIAELDESLKPQNEAIQALEKTSHDAKARVTAAEAACTAAAEAVRAARLCRDLAATHILLFEKIDIHTKLSEKKKIVSDRRSNLAELEKQLAGLPKVDKAKLNKIQKLETEYSNARAALQAMAAGLVVVSADQPVKIGGEPVPQGQQQIVTEETEVQIGEIIRLRIHPGGGNSLAAARKTELEARNELQEALDSLGLKLVSEAAEAFAGREDLVSRIKAIGAELKGMGADDLAEELQTATNELAAAEAAMKRLSEMSPDLKTPEDKSSAKALLKTLEATLGEDEAREVEANATHKRLLKVLESAEDSLKDKRAEIEQQKLKLNGLNAQLELLLKTHGGEVARSAALVECQAAKTAAQNLLKTTTDAIAALQPDLLDGDRTRIGRAIREKTSEQGEARSRIAVARSALRSDGSEDPLAGLAIAEAKAHTAVEHRSSVQRQGEAILLLNRLFQDEQRSLAKQFTQPLADKISAYLECIFGPGANAQVDLEDGKFTSLRLLRPSFGDAPFAFHKLSGGAKEQTAAAVRLAMAELLAADHDGCLPVVFDDAFAYSDPDRVKQLQRMLDLAASRGLQVIVLTCTPADYATLGAKTVTLRPERFVQVIRTEEEGG